MRKAWDNFTFIISAIIMVGAIGAYLFLSVTDNADEPSNDSAGQPLQIVVSPTPIPTVTSSPTPIPAFVNTATALCESSATLPEELFPETLPIPLQVVFKRDYEPMMWQMSFSYRWDQQNFDRSPSAGYDPALLPENEVQALICVTESRTEVTQYSGGQPGYRLDWGVVVMTYPQGEVIGSFTLTGGEPPNVLYTYENTASAAVGYGDPPDLDGWLMGVWMKFRQG